jgi:hypothetical protein
MPNFAFPSLLGPGFLVLYLAVGLPILIHLINMLRHRRVEWAAMEFLLASHKKHRTWVRMKQLLLLLMRMAALALVAFLVAQPLLRNQLGSFFGSSSTHHIVLLDDSFSMSDQWADTNAFSEAKRAIERLGRAAAERAEAQSFTLVRFSQVGRAQPDMQQEGVNREEFVKQLESTLQAVGVSQLAVGPLGALREVAQLIGEGGNERRNVYLFSDFRHRDWNEPAELHKQMLELNEQQVTLHLVNCVDRARPNLAITALAPAEGIQAAQVPFTMEVSVHNFGQDTSREVQVLLEEDGHASPAVVIPSISGGQSVTQSFPVNFPTAGEHEIVARLDSDAVPLDNMRYGILRLPVEVPLLLVDGDPDSRDARFVNIAAAPGGTVRTGLRPQIEQPRFLSIRPLDEFQAINLFNIDHLDPSAVAALERFIEAGGGVAMFVGDRTQAKFVNEQLYRDGQGFFPLPLRSPAELLIDRLERAPDVETGQHFIFRVFGDARNPFAAALSVQRYFAAADNWRPNPESTVEVLARLRNGAPLVVSRTFGKGRVVVFLTTAGPSWNNWALNPSFVVLMQDLQAFLAHRAALDVSRQVGTPLALTLDPGQYKQGIRFALPSSETPSATVDASATSEGALAASLADTYTAGIYQAALTRAVDDAIETRRFAFNVDPQEGNLQVISKTDLASRLDGVKYLYEQADMFQYAAGEMAGQNIGQTLLTLLIVLLLAEQFVAWSASYHPSASASAKGGAR